MPFLCQDNSYANEFKSPIISSQKATLKIQNEIIEGYDVVLEQTIFFPEGGGQPYDTGFLGAAPVINVRRQGKKAILFVKSDPSLNENFLDVGQQPLQKIDWVRRFDHMQQHSGQHLITAVASKHFKLETTSWSLGANMSNIELDSPDVQPSVVDEIERIVNEKIRENLPVKISYRDQSQLDDVRFNQELPEDQIGEPLRVISIGSLDKNLCCGTHVSNLSHLQSVKLFGTQKGKQGKTLLLFLVGNRVLNYLNEVIKREKLLSSALKCPNENFVSSVEKLQKNAKNLQKNSLNAMRDIGKLEAEKYLALEEKPLFYTIHRKENEYDFITIFINTVGDSINDRLLMLSITEDKTLQIMIAGNQELVIKCSNIVSQFGVKGSVSKNRFRGRVQDVSILKKIEFEIQGMLDT